MFGHRIGVWLGRNVNRDGRFGGRRRRIRTDRHDGQPEPLVRPGARQSLCAEGRKHRGDNLGILPQIGEGIGGDVLHPLAIDNAFLRRATRRGKARGDVAAAHLAPQVYQRSGRPLIQDQRDKIVGGPVRRPRREPSSRSNLCRARADAIGQPPLPRSGPLHRLRRGKDHRAKP